MAVTIPACGPNGQARKGKIMFPPTQPPPSLFPYLSSIEAGWDGLVALAFHEPPDVEEFIVPTGTDIVLSLIASGGQYWEMREKRAHSSWDGVVLHAGDFILGTGTNVPYESRWRSTSLVPTYSFTLRLSRNLLARTVEEMGGDATRLILLGQAGFQDSFLLQMALSLWRELQEEAPSGNLFAECAAQMLMFHLLRHYSGSSDVVAALEEPTHRLTTQQLHRVSTYIRDHTSTDLSP